MKVQELFYDRRRRVLESELRWVCHYKAHRQLAYNLALTGLCNSFTRASWRKKHFGHVISLKLIEGGSIPPFLGLACT